MQAHQLYAILPFGRLTFSGLERRVCEKIRELVNLIIIICFGFKVTSSADQFFQVFNARDGFFAAFLAVVIN